MALVSLVGVAAGVMALVPPANTPTRPTAAPPARSGQLAVAAQVQPGTDAVTPVPAAANPAGAKPAAAARPTTVPAASASPRGLPASAPPTASTSVARPARAAPPLWGPGYRLAAADGGVFSYGNARFLGSLGSKRLSSPVVGIADTPSGQGYWEVGSAGGVFAFGDASYHGGLAGRPLSSPIVGLAATPDGHGYWLVAADGGVFAFGDAVYHGGRVGRPFSARVVGMAAVPDGGGYWLVSADGGVFAFGDAAYYGGLASHGTRAHVVGMASTPDGHGYWLAATDGGVFTYGTARYYGSMGAARGAQSMVGIAASPTGAGYWLVSADGGVFTYGDAGYWGAPGGLGINRPVTGVAAGLDPPYHPGQAQVGSRVGFDISWPQCADRGLPASHAFVVLGVTGGQAFTDNSCLGSEWVWATSASGAAGLYMNLNGPGRDRARTGNGPAGHCRSKDQACLAYNYGTNAVNAALAYAASSRASSPMWWLDIETGNAWTPSPAVNALVVKGAIDQLHRRGLQVGIYSDSLQWGDITGGATFGVPVWVAGAASLGSAPSYCSERFDGGPVWMVQTTVQYDMDYLCRPSYVTTAFGVHPLPAAPVYALDRLPDPPAALSH